MLARRFAFALALFALAASPYPAHYLQPDAGLSSKEVAEPLNALAECDNRLCWNQQDKWSVAYICYDEARGLLIAGMASCAAVVANRQAHPEIWGSAVLSDVVRYSQFPVISAKMRPWERGTPPPPEALAAVEAFLDGPAGPGCWGYDSFQASTPEVAPAWLAVAPDKHCIVIRPPQALLFFNWRDG